jgi:nitrilase
MGQEAVNMNKESFKVAAVQAMPVFLDREATVDKACALIAEAGRNGARLAVFPEGFIPVYPDWIWAVPAGVSSVLADLYAELLENAVEVPSPATRRLCEAARDAGVFVAMGMSERNVEASGSSLYNTLLYISDQGEIMGKHRKLVPTGGERLVWAPGDGSTLDVYDTPLGRLGGLICWENYMPLARYAMYAWGTQIYIAATWATGEAWLSTVRHIAREGRVYVISCCMPMRKSDIPERFGLAKQYYGHIDDWINRGESVIVDPNGKILAGPVNEREEILYAEVDPRLMSGTKWLLDVAGHYARPDVFSLTVNKEARPMLRVRERDRAAGEDGDGDGRGMENHTKGI